MLSAPDSFHDAATWQMSTVKGWLSAQVSWHYVLGDAAYPLSDHYLTPYSNDQAQADFNKGLFNLRHSGAKMEPFECVYGMFKHRFPLVKYIRYFIIHIKYLVT